MSAQEWQRPNTWLHTRPYEPQKAVGEFHRAFGQQRYWDIPRNLDGTETQAHVDLRRLRAALILEEAREAIEALGFSVLVVESVPGSPKGLVEIPGFEYDEEHLAKELADVLYVTYGTGDTQSLPVEDVYQEVHRSNMSKLVDGKPLRREDGKFLKGPNYRPADVHGVLTGHWL